MRRLWIFLGVICLFVFLLGVIWYAVTYRTPEEPAYSTYTPPVSWQLEEIDDGIRDEACEPSGEDCAPITRSYTAAGTAQEIVDEARNVFADEGWEFGEVRDTDDGLEVEGRRGDERLYITAQDRKVVVRYEP